MSSSLISGSFAAKTHQKHNVQNDSFMNTIHIKYLRDIFLLCYASPTTVAASFSV